jgi:hypothetical protein
VSVTPRPSAVTPPSTADGLALVTLRPLIAGPIDVRFRLAPGDRALVAAGERVARGASLAERLRDGRLEEVFQQLPEGRPGSRWSGLIPVGSLGLRRQAAEANGELLFGVGDRWRIVTGEHFETLESPLAGEVREVQSGTSILVRADGRGLPAAAAVGTASRGMLTLATGPDGELRSGAIDVGAAGRILVAGSRVDAETLTRARAMGVRGMIVAGLAGKERRDFLASEARQRASLHRPPPFGVLILDGAVRRSIASPVMAILAALAGHEVAIVADPPALVFDDPEIPLPSPNPALVRVRSGRMAGREGRWEGLAGLRRFAAGTHLEAGMVAFDDDPPIALPLSDLERYA